MNQIEYKKKRIKLRILPYIFMLLVFFPFINKNLQFVIDNKSMENRALGKYPPMVIGNLDSYPNKYENYFNDHFDLRNKLLQYFNLFKIFLFNTPVTDKAMIGKDDWLYLTQKELDTYQGKKLFSNDELDRMVEELEYRKKYLYERRCEFYIVVVPLKHSLYSEYLPSFVTRAITNSTDQFVNYIQKNTKLKILDLRPVLAKIKEQTEYPLFYKTDTHWNELGGFYASKEIIDFIKKDFEQIPSLNEEDYTITDTGYFSGNTARLISMQNLIGEKNILVHKKGNQIVYDAKKCGYEVPKGFPYSWDYENVRITADTSLPKVLVIRDSFGNATRRFLPSAFSKTTYIFDSWDHKLNKKIIENEKPDIYISLILERFIKRYLDKTEKNFNENS